MWENQILSFLMNIISIKTFVSIITIYLIIIWITIIVWVIKDINNRITSIILKTIIILTTIVFWPLWALFYLLIRPATTFSEKYSKEIEWNIDYLTSEILKRLSEKERRKIKEESTSEIKKIKTKHLQKKKKSK